MYLCWPNFLSVGIEFVTCFFGICLETGEETTGYFEFLILKTVLHDLIISLSAQCWDLTL